MRARLTALTLCALAAACGKDPGPAGTGTGTPGRVVEGPFTGIRVDASPDVTGDGRPDLLVTAPGLDGRGAVRVFDAAASGALGAGDAAASILGGSDGAIGEGLAACGDLDGDGQRDLAIGLPKGNAGRGGVWLVHGPVTGDSQADAAYLVRGTELDVDTGYDVHCGGDFDGDGHADLVFTAPFAEGFGIAEVTGEVYFHASVSFATDAVANFSSTFSDETLGYHRALSIAHDLDGDGLADAAVGGPGTSRVHLVFAPFAGTYDANTTGSKLDGREDDDAFGHAVAVGDLNGDGYADVAAGAPRFGPQIGAIGVVEGPFDPTSPGGRVTELGRWVDGQDPRSLTGFSLAIAGDLDGDAQGDLIVGAPGVTTSGPEAGVVYVVAGPADIAGVFAAPHVLVGLTPYGQFGHSVAAVPDANGDGLDEVLVGAPYRDDGDRVGAGAAFLFHSPVPARVDDTAATATLVF